MTVLLGEERPEATYRKNLALHGQVSEVLLATFSLDDTKAEPTVPVPVPCLIPKIEMPDEISEQLWKQMANQPGALEETTTLQNLHSQLLLLPLPQVDLGIHSVRCVCQPSLVWPDVIELLVNLLPLNLLPLNSRLVPLLLDEEELFPALHLSVPLILRD
jgi:hypothetical protein